MILALALALALAGNPSTPRPPALEVPAPSADARELPPLSAEDAAVVEHLELLQSMELLEDLPVVDVEDEE